MTGDEHEVLVDHPDAERGSRPRVERIATGSPSRRISPSSGESSP